MEPECRRDRFDENDACRTAARAGWARALLTLASLRRASRLHVPVACSRFRGIAVAENVTSRRR
jgi:hypothetical protein